MGLFNRGIKTRIGSNGNSDYYGIIRECSIRSIPAVIVEHCHVDNINDTPYIQSPEKLREFGVRDAQAVARYFGLVSKDKTKGLQQLCSAGSTSASKPRAQRHDSTGVCQCKSFKNMTRQERLRR